MLKGEVIAVGACERMDKTKVAKEILEKRKEEG
jgi:hypothetical protein